MEKRISFALGILLHLSLFHTAFAANQNLRVGTGAGCTHATLQAALTALQSQDGTHNVRINKGVYAVPEGMTYNPTVAQSAVFLEGGYADCTAPAPSGDPNSDADRAVFDGAGGSLRSVLDVSVYGEVGSFQMRRIVLRGGDATIVDNATLNSGGGLIVRGQASVLIGVGTSIRGNAAVNGGGVALSGSNIGSASGYYGRVDFFIDAGAEIRNNTATGSGGGIYCGGDNNDPDFTPPGERHGSIVLRDGIIGFNQAHRGAAFYCIGSLDGGGGFQPRPLPNTVAWIVGNQIVSTGAGGGCAAGQGTLDSVLPVEGDGYRHLGAAANSTGLVAITSNSGDRTPALCLGGSRPRNAVNDPAPIGQSRFRLRNLIIQDQSGPSFLGLSIGNALDLIVEPSGDSVTCTFFTPTACVRFNANSASGVGGDANLLFISNNSRLQVRRALIEANTVRGDLVLAINGGDVTLLSSILDDNTVAATASAPSTSALFAARAGGTVDVRNSTVISRSSLSQFYRLGKTSVADGTGTAFAQSSAFNATVGAPVLVGLEGGAAASQFNRFWCGYFINTSGFAGHTVVNDPATGVFYAAPSFSVAANYAPSDTALRDKCSQPPGTLNRDFYGRPFNVAFALGGPLADIGAVEAQLDILFRDGFE